MLPILEDSLKSDDQKKIMERFWRLCREVSKKIESNHHPKVTSPGELSAYFG